MLLSEIIFNSEYLRIEYFSNQENTNTSVALTYTARMNRNLDGNGWGGNFLIKNRFDIVAFKCSNDDWFQSVPKDIFHSINALLNANNYKKRVAYGASMGGYAAIQFSESLKCDVVLAYSPRFPINQNFDSKWSFAPIKTNWNYHISNDSINRNCKYFLVYDNKDDKDKLPIEHLTHLVSAENLVKVKIPFSGHPTSTYLQEVNLLEKLALQVFNKLSIENLKFKENKSKSKSYLHCLSNHLHRLGRLDGAIQVAKGAIALDDKNPHSKAHLSILLEKKGLLTEALAIIDLAINIDPEVAGFYGHKSYVLYRLGRLDDAIQVAKDATALDDKSPHLKNHVSHLLWKRKRSISALVGMLYFWLYFKFISS